MYQMGMLIYPMLLSLVLEIARHVPLTLTIAPVASIIIY